MTHDMELVKDDPGLRCVVHDRVPERLPHVNRRQLDAGTLFLAQRLEKQVDVSLFSAFTTDPDRALPIQVTDDDPVVMSFTDGDLINTDGPGCRQARQDYLILYVQLIEIFHRAVVQAFHLGDCLVRHISAQLAHMHGKTLRIARVICQPVKMFYMHAGAPQTTDTTAFKQQVDSPPGNGEVSYPQHLLVVTSSTPLTTVRTDGRFSRLLSWITRAYRSPNLPTNFDATVKPGNANSARVDLGFFMALA